MNSSHPYIIFVATWPLWIFTAWVLWNMRRDSRDEKLIVGSLDWPESQGKVLESAVAWAHVEVSYEYHADGVRYRGSYQINLSPILATSIGTGATTSMARQHNREVSEAYREFYPGKDIVVRYNPRKPSESVFYRVGEVSVSSQKQSNSTAPKFLVLT
jgi:uncharacterized protein DUF3592